MDSVLRCLTRLYPGERVRLAVILDDSVGLGMDVVLKTACVQFGDLFRHAHGDQDLHKQLMAFIDALRDLKSLFRQRDMIVCINFDKSAGTEILQHDRDRRAGISKVVADIRGANELLLSGKDQNRFKVIFC